MGSPEFRGVRQQIVRQIVGGLIGGRFQAVAPRSPNQAVRIVREILNHAQSLVQGVQREMVASLERAQVLDRSCCARIALILRSGVERVEQNDGCARRLLVARD